MEVPRSLCMDNEYLLNILAEVVKILETLGKIQTIFGTIGQSLVEME